MSTPNAQAPRKRTDIPFNITLLSLTPEKLRGLKQISVLDSFDGATTDFHPEGLFSTTIFGKVGDPRRDLLFAYIDIRIPILHPIVYDAVIKLKRMYEGIMAGTVYATWNDVTKDFDASRPSLGETGYAFFIKHFADISFKATSSIGRDQSIKLITRYKDTALTDKIVVMPAGLRDMEIDEHGRRREDEINKLYRTFMALTNTITDAAVRNNPEIVNKPRYELQRNFNALYDLIESLIKGKKKLFLGRFASRRIFHGTRNVITAMNPAVPILGAKGSHGINSTIMGLYQYLQGTLPVSVPALRDFLSNIFHDVNQPAILVNKKTLKSTEVMLHSRYYDQWGTAEGLEKVIGSFKEESLRTIPIEIDGYYLGLVYIGPDKTFRFFQDISELPVSRMKEHVRPVTLTDILYMAVYRNSSKHPCYVTRYPTTGIGSIYPSMTHLRPTVNSMQLRCLNRQWLDMGDDYTAYEYPRIDSAFVNSLVPHPAHLSRLDAD